MTKSMRGLTPGSAIMSGPLNSCSLVVNTVSTIRSIYSGRVRGGGEGAGWKGSVRRQVVRL